MIPESKAYSTDRRDGEEGDSAMSWEEYYEKEPLKQVIRRLISSTSKKTS